MGRLRRNLVQLTQGLHALGLVVLGGETPIISVLTGDEDITLQAGRFLFDQGFYVQSVTFPAVPYHAGVLRIQVNANHLPESIEALGRAMAALQTQFALPTAAELAAREAA